MGESWRSRALRRVSIIPMAMGLQPWVTGRQGHGTSPHRARKKRKYEDIKTLINGGKLGDAKAAVRDGDWDVHDDIRTRLWPFLTAIHETKHTSGDYWELVKEIFGHQREGIALCNYALCAIDMKEEFIDFFFRSTSKLSLTTWSVSTAKCHILQSRRNRNCLL